MWLLGLIAIPKSVELYKAAAEQGDAHANYNLGSIFLNGDGVERDIETGINYLREAARLGDDVAKIDFVVVN